MPSRNLLPLASTAAAVLILGSGCAPDTPPARHGEEPATAARTEFSRAQLVFGDYFHLPSSGAVLPAPGSPWTLMIAHLAAGDDGLHNAAGAMHASLLAAGHWDPDGRDAAGLTLLRRARTLVDRSDAASAIAVYDSAASALPWLGDWVALFAASAAATAGDTTAVRSWMAGADPDLLEWGWRIEPRALRQAGDRRGAVAAAELAAARLTSPARRAAALTYAGQLRQERQDHAGARRAWIQAINVAEGSLAALDAARLLVSLPGATPGDHLIAGRVFMRQGNVQRGTASLQAYVEWPGANRHQRQRARVEIAEALFRSGDHARAARELLAIGEALAASATTPADSALAAHALFTAGRARFRDGGVDHALDLLRSVARRFDTAPAAAQAAFLAADLLHDRNDFGAALTYYRAAIRIAPASVDAAAAHMRIGGLAFAEGRYQDALVQFEEFRRTQSAGRPLQQAAFWAGMSAARAGDHDRALQHFVDARDHDPITYYGGLAAEQIGDGGWYYRLAHPPPASARQRALAAGALARADALRAAGWSDAATFEMERARRSLARVDGAAYALAEALHERGAISAGVSLAWEIFRAEGEWNSRLLRILYPFPFRELIFAEARQRNVDPFLAAALIRQESMFNPGARSPVGAAGLMQVMPATARSLARRVNVSRFTPDMLMRPEVNVLFGTTYLADQLSTYSHRLDLVLAAYNAGPGRVRRWQAFPEYADHLLFAERIPFDETRDYVRVVLNNRRIYAALYAADLATATLTE